MCQKLSFFVLNSNLPYTAFTKFYLIIIIRNFFSHSSSLKPINIFYKHAYINISGSSVVSQNKIIVKMKICLTVPRNDRFYKIKLLIINMMIWINIKWGSWIVNFDFIRHFNIFKFTLFPRNRFLGLMIPLSPLPLKSSNWNLCISFQF